MKKKIIYINNFLIIFIFIVFFIGLNRNNIYDTKEILEKKLH